LKRTYKKLPFVTIQAFEITKTGHRHDDDVFPLHGVTLDLITLSLKPRKLIFENQNLEDACVAQGITQPPSKIQNDPYVQEDIKLVARQSIRKLYIKSAEELDPPFMSINDQTLLANCNIRGFLKAGSKAEIALSELEGDSIAIINDSVAPKGKINKVLRSVPLAVRSGLPDSYDYQEIVYGIFVKGKFLNLFKIPSSKLQLLLKSAFKKLSQPQNWLNQPVDWNRLWAIKNPTLRAIRFKLAHKDIFSNTRRKACKLTTSDKCVICGETETVSHLLLECINAKRIWLILESLMNIKLDNLFSLLCVCHSSYNELIISVALKYLIQIDRSQFIAISEILNKILYFLKVEQATKPSFQLDIVISKVISVIDRAKAGI